MILNNILKLIHFCYLQFFHIVRYEIFLSGKFGLSLHDLWEFIFLPLTGHLKSIDFIEILQKQTWFVGAFFVFQQGLKISYGCN